MLAFSILIYLLANLGVGLWASKRISTTQDFVLAGRRLPLILAASATFATWFGSETIMGAPTEFVENGLLGVYRRPFRRFTMPAARRTVFSRVSFTK
jgi:SSS family solute:Na+ symporter